MNDIERELDAMQKKFNGSHAALGICIEERDRARAACEEKEREVERLKTAMGTVFCPWCQSTYPKTDQPYEAVMRHLNECLKHPISERDQLRSSLTALEAECKRMVVALQFISACENLSDARKAALQAGICAALNPTGGEK